MSTVPLPLSNRLRCCNVKRCFCITRVSQKRIVFLAGVSRRNGTWLLFRVEHGLQRSFSAFGRPRPACDYSSSKCEDFSSCHFSLLLWCLYYVPSKIIAKPSDSTKFDNVEHVECRRWLSNHVVKSSRGLGCALDYRFRRHRHHCRHATVPGTEEQWDKNCGGWLDDYGKPGARLLYDSICQSL